MYYDMCDISHSARTQTHYEPTHAAARMPTPCWPHIPGKLSGRRWEMQNTPPDGKRQERSDFLYTMSYSMHIQFLCNIH